MVGGSVDRKHRIVQFCREFCSLRLLTWVVALSSAAWSSYVYYDRSFRCPEGTVCIEGDSFGAGPPVTPYTEFTEVTNSHAVYRVSALLKTEQSPYQLVQAYQSHFFGKILVIDGALMITERDESNYHETLVHTTLNYLPDARRVLVIGGGDGGTVTQLLKHPNLREIVWVEIDEVVLRFARQFFPHLAKAQSDPRVTLRVQNAARFVQEAQYPAVGVNNGALSPHHPYLTLPHLTSPRLASPRLTSPQQAHSTPSSSTRPTSALRSPSSPPPSTRTAAPSSRPEVCSPSISTRHSGGRCGWLRRLSSSRASSSTPTSSSATSPRTRRGTTPSCSPHARCTRSRPRSTGRGALPTPHTCWEIDTLHLALTRRLIPATTPRAPRAPPTLPTPPSPPTYRVLIVHWVHLQGTRPRGSRRATTTPTCTMPPSCCPRRQPSSPV